MKKFSYILLLLIISTTTTAQTVSKSKLKEWNMLKNNQEYICGEGKGKNESEARKAAQTSLINQISVSVKDVTNIESESKEKNGTLDETSQFHQSVSTYSQMTLNNTTEYTLSMAPNVVIGLAIKKSEVERMFTERANRAKDMVATALRAEKKGKVDDALRNYYWSLSLLKSLQYPNYVTFEEPDGTSHVLTNWIKEKMEDIFDELKFNCVSREGNDIELCVTYHEKPVSSAAFSYFDGRQWSPTLASDGCANLELAKGFNNKMLQLKVEYQFIAESKQDKEIASVLSMVKTSEFPHATKQIKSIKAPKNDEVKRSTEPEALKATAMSGTFTSNKESEIAKPKEIENKTEYQNIITVIEQAIRKKQTDNIQKYFTTEGWDIYTRLIQYGSARIVGVPRYAFYANNDEVTARGLQLSFSFKNGVKKSFVEEVIFTFDSNRKIDNISFGLGRTAEDDILNRGKGKWSENVRLTIMNFLENYKTAFALKRFDYIKSIFDDNAIIITGKVVKKASITNKDGITKFGQDIIKYNRQTKDQYLKNLQECFNSQEFINIQFAENDVQKARKNLGETYGIQIEQNYYSTSYGDHGYLFLWVDMNDPKAPLIKVRTWQPHKDPNVGRNGIYGLNEFK